jgi:hypothetical protein
MAATRIHTLVTLVFRITVMQSSRVRRPGPSQFTSDSTADLRGDGRRNNRNPGISMFIRRRMFPKNDHHSKQMDDL